MYMFPSDIKDAKEVEANCDELKNVIHAQCKDKTNGFKKIRVTDFDSIKLITCYFKNGKLDGMVTCYNKALSVVKRVRYSNDLKHGLAINYDKHGRVSAMGNFIKGSSIMWTSYKGNDAGSLEKHIMKFV